MDLFTDDYLEDWRHRTNEWNTPFELRIKCDCDAELFINMIQPGGITLFQSCDDCGKVWCINCGDQQHAPYGTPYSAPSAHSTVTNPDACGRTLATKTQQRQAQVTGLIKGIDYQVCPMCNRYTKNGNDPAQVQCDGCATIFGFTCGLEHWPSPLIFYHKDGTKSRGIERKTVQLVG